MNTKAGEAKVARKSEEQKRAEFLDTVESIVNNNRNSQYGGAENSFTLVATLWTIYLSTRRASTGTEVYFLGPLDVALMMDLLKTARLATNITHFDSWLDKAGYAACGGSLINP